MVDASGMRYGDEVFIAGLLQDIGVMALLKAMKRDYLAVISQTGGDHRKLVRAELSALEVQHPDIGAMLAQRWKLPDSLVIPVKYHERPTAAPSEHTEIVHGVGLGNLVHDAIVLPETAEHLRKLYERAGQWLNLTPDRIDAALKRAREATEELADLFKLDIGLDDVEATAEKTLAASQGGEMDGPTPSAGIELLLIDPNDLDPRTGLLGRKGFEWAIRRAFLFSAEQGEPATLVQVMLVPGPTDPAADAARLGALLRKHFTATGAAICKLNDRVFSVVAVGASDREMVAISDTVRASFGHSAPGPRTHVGIVHFGEGAATRFTDPGDIVRAAVAAINTARTTGRSAA
jgi:hypothetical protein